MHIPLAQLVLYFICYYVKIYIRPGRNMTVNIFLIKILLCRSAFMGKHYKIVGIHTGSLKT